MSAFNSFRLLIDKGTACGVKGRTQLLNVMSCKNKRYLLTVCSIRCLTNEGIALYKAIPYHFQADDPLNQFFSHK